jgi:phosphoglycolate phosphatase-like HAD superfamily hydrolase
MDFASQMEQIFPGHPKNREVIDAFETKKREGLLDHPLFPEVIPTLDFFNSRNIKQFVCTSTKSELLSQYVKKYKIADRVDAYFGYEPDFGKDRQIEFVLEQHDLEPEEVIFVGDSLRDGDFAKGREVPFIGIRRIVDENAFQQRGLPSVQDLTELTRLWKESDDLLQYVEQ